MQVNAVYNKGRLEFGRQIRFARESFPVVVELPDSEILTAEPEKSPGPPQSAPSSKGSILLAEIRQILGPLYQERPAVSLEQDREAYIDELEEKYKK